ncbi:MAG: tyrosine-type recombinase/integrase, partial [Thermoleophilia bacterium]
MSEAVDVWLAAKEREPGARAGSLATYQGRAGHIRAYFGTTPVRAVRPEHLTRFTTALLEEGYAPATVQGIYAALTSALRHAQRRGVIAALPLPPDGPGIPTPRARTPALTLAQVETIIGEMPGVWGKVAELALLTGCRWGELVAIEEGDIDGAVLHVRRPQTRG